MVLGSSFRSRTFNFSLDKLNSNLGRPKLSEDCLFGQTSNLDASNQSTESDQKEILAERG